MTDDRFHRAWLLRRDLHALIAGQPGICTGSILAAFADRPGETVRKALFRMRADGDISAERKGGPTMRYFAERDEVRPESDSRAAKAAGALRGRLRNSSLSAEDKLIRRALVACQNLMRARRACRVDARQKPAPHDPAREPWRTVHRGGSTPPIQNQGGQGALRHRVTINCSGAWT